VPVVAGVENVEGGGVPVRVERPAGLVLVGSWELRGGWLERR
jgi:hypothetical protein